MLQGPDVLLSLNKQDGCCRVGMQERWQAIEAPEGGDFLAWGWLAPLARAIGEILGKAFLAVGQAEPTDAAAILILACKGFEVAN